MYNNSKTWENGLNLGVLINFKVKSNNKNQSLLLSMISINKWYYSIGYTENKIFDPSGVGWFLINDFFYKHLNSMDSEEIFFDTTKLNKIDNKLKKPDPSGVEY